MKEETCTRCAGMKHTRQHLTHRNQRRSMWQVRAFAHKADCTSGGIAAQTFIRSDAHVEERGAVFPGAVGHRSPRASCLGNTSRAPRTITLHRRALRLESELRTRRSQQSYGSTTKAASEAHRGYHLTAPTPHSELRSCGRRPREGPFTNFISFPVRTTRWHEEQAPFSRSGLS